jgi:hypothetical protein
MGLGSLLAQAVEAARAATESLGVQGLVQHEAWLSQGATGEALYATPVAELALIAEGEQQLVGKDGHAIRVRAVLIFFPPAPGEVPPTIGPRDRHTQPSGLTGPIAELPNAAVDPATGAVLMRIAWLG